MNKKRIGAHKQNQKRKCDRNFAPFLCSCFFVIFEHVDGNTTVNAGDSAHLQTAVRWLLHTNTHKKLKIFCVSQSPFFHIPFLLSGTLHIFCYQHRCCFIHFLICTICNQQVFKYMYVCMYAYCGTFAMNAFNLFYRIFVFVMRFRSNKNALIYLNGNRKI